MVDEHIPARVYKPSRSDEVIDPDQQLQIAEKVRAQFETLAPKRATKPNRSEPDPDDSSQSAHHQAHVVPIPELQRLQSLKSLSQVVIPRAGEGGVQEEFVETQYYKELVSIDKHHHTTGSGFIKVGKEDESVENNGCDLIGSQRLSENVERKNNNDGSFSGFKTNPATNDWTPILEAHDHQVAYISAKPSRSG